MDNKKNVTVTAWKVKLPDKIVDLFVAGDSDLKPVSMTPDYDLLG